ncbi:MAG: hypothetical protein O0X93_02385 [Methanocorpusculum sp.]|nr:hypothetical protein [Methanocorpusculum sp.]MDE2519452.1 hypothetical protein [Methanocorpusculum sp.]MDE2521995.1 hypothetical protein [Methanocorpusculum sp.]MDE2523816.1 hypothetical protein [Methanocorpusculum sp.]
MGILGQLERALGVWYPDPDADPDDTNPVVAVAFREYVMNRLGDAYSVADREERATGEPDLVCVRNADEARFDLITCYRSRMFVGEDREAYLPWTTSETYAAYRTYAETEENPCLVIIGLHGFADEPKFLFAVPLTEAVPNLPRTVLQKYEVKKDAELF